MKKSIFLLMIAFLFCVAGCGPKDFVVGKWQISSYSYVDSEYEYTYTKEDATNLIQKYIQNEISPTSLKERVEQAIANACHISEDMTYKFLNDNSVKITKNGQQSSSYIWSRTENSLVLEYDSLQLQWTVDEENKLCYSSMPFENGEMIVRYEKI